MLTAIRGATTRILNAVKSESALVLATENGKIRLEPYGADIIRITCTLQEEMPEKSNPGIVLKPPAVQWSYVEDEARILLKTDKLTVEITKESGAFRYLDAQGTRVAGEPDRGGKILSPFDSYKTVFDGESVVERVETPDGIKEVVRDAKRVFDRVLFHTRLSFEFDPDEAIYGLGSHEEGSLNLRGTRQYVHQANMKSAMPFFVSTNGYGMLMDTCAPVIFNDDEYGSYLYSMASEALDYYFIYGGTPDGVIRGYRTLTGKAPLLPLWAFGYIQSQERYETQQEILDTVLEYRRRQVPLDCIVLDWQSWEDGLWGQKTFDSARFPDPRGMTDALHGAGAHFMISVWPNMVTDSADYLEMKAASCLLPNAEIYDAFSEKARRLYWEQADRGLFSNGVDAWWCDSSEPYTPEWNTPVKPEPDANLLDFHQTASRYLEERMTNAYPLMHARAMYEGQRGTTTEKRVVNLTRSGYTGQQRYGVILWSGDTSAKWSTLRKQIPAGLNCCASGIPYWTLDIGAFFVKKGHMWFWDGDFEAGSEDLGYRELYTRWYQYGAFLPVFRSHGTDTRREIWQFGDKGDMFYDSLEKFTRMRYALMPYIYSTAAAVTFRDGSMMRPLAFDFPTDARVRNIRDEYMFGPSLLVCPVTEPMYYGPGSRALSESPRTRNVYLPAGTDWTDFWTGTAHRGGQTVSVNAAIDTMPLFVRTGTILPMAEAAQHTGAIRKDRIDLRVYPGADGTFSLYQDEGDSYRYEDGQFATIDMTWQEKAGTLTLHPRKGRYPGMPETITFHVSGLTKTPLILVYHNDMLVFRRP